MLDEITVTGQVERLFAEKLLLEVDSVDTDLLQTGTLDSVKIVELLLHVEECFGVSLPIERLEIDDFRSIQKIARLIERSGEVSPSPGVQAILNTNQ